MKRLSNPFVRLSASLLVALALFTGVGCNEGSNVADNANQRPSISQQALDHMPAAVREAIEAKQANEASIMAIDGVNGVGVGLSEDGNPCILVLTERGNVNGLPKTVAGYKVRVENIGKVEAYGKPGTGAPKPVPGYTGVYSINAIPCGVSIGNNNECAAGTLGCRVKNAVGQSFILSNWHVLSGAGANGGTINQPGLYDAPVQCYTNGTNSIGSTASSQLIPISTAVGTTNLVDCGIATINDNVTVLKTFADNTTYSSTTKTATPGMAVRKVGRTTGVTSNTISGVDVTIRVGYDHGTATFVHQLYVASGKFIKSGDSGSLMTTNGGSGGNQPVGLLFAGSATSSIANPIDAVLSALNVTIDGQ
jgi:hypothetical protein